MDERKYCSVCGAHELVKIGDVLRDGEMYKVHRCLSCDSELSDYDIYLRKKKAAERAARRAARAREDAKGGGHLAQAGNGALRATARGQGEGKSGPRNAAETEGGEREQKPRFATAR